MKDYQIYSFKLIMKKDPDNVSMDVAALRKEGETLDDVLNGGLQIFQKAGGYRFSLDSLLLANFVRLRKKDRILDLGTGSGVIALILAKRWNFAKVVGVDVQEDIVDMARRSVEINHLSNRVDIRLGDVKKIASLCEAQSFDVAIANPPYRKLHSGRINPNEQKAVARHEIKGSLGDFLVAAQYALKKSGRVFLIYPAVRMVELMSWMRKIRLEPKRLKLVYSKANSNGEFILVEGVKGGREELHTLSPLFIYEENGEYSGEMVEIFNDLSALPSP